MNTDSILVNYDKLVREILLPLRKVYCWDDNKRGLDLALEVLTTVKDIHHKNERHDVMGFAYSHRISTNSTAVSDGCIDRSRHEDDLVRLVVFRVVLFVS